MNYLTQIVQQFMALKRRERILAITAFLGLIYFVVDLSLLRPQQVRAKALQQKIAQQEVELATLSASLQALAATGAADPLKKLRAERDELRSTFALAETVVSRASAGTRTGDVIRSMVKATPGLTLMSLKTLPPEVFFQGAAQPAAGAPMRPASVADSSVQSIQLPTLYRHGIELTVQGPYGSLMSYLQALERNADGSFWGAVKLDVLVYPDATLRITIFNLSARPALQLG